MGACLYNLERKVIVLGEAKFYENFGEGINKIISDFVNKSIKNKLESLQTNAENCEETSHIIIKNLKIEDYDELTIDQFMNQRIVFAGFVLQSEKNVSQYSKLDFYNKYFISTQQLEGNIKASLKHDNIEGEYVYQP